MWQEGGSIWVWEPKGQQEVFVLLIQINFFTSGLWILITSSWQQPKWNCSTALLSALVLLPRQLLWLFFKDGRSGVLKAPWRAGTVPLNTLPPRNNPYQSPLSFIISPFRSPFLPPGAAPFRHIQISLKNSDLNNFILLSAQVENTPLYSHNTPCPGSWDSFTWHMTADSFLLPSTTLSSSQPRNTEILGIQDSSRSPWHLRHPAAWLQLEGTDKRWVTQALLETQCTRNKSSWNFREFQPALLISFEEPCTMANIGLGWFMWLNSPFQRASGGTSEPGEGQTRQRAWGTVLH